MTKPGLYAAAFGAALGVIAILSGSNGLFVILSLGIAIVVVSIAMSGRVLKPARVTFGYKLRADAHSAFHVKLQVTNSSRRVSLVGLEHALALQPVRRRWLARRPESPLEFMVPLVAPSETLTCAAYVHGLPRGVYRDLSLLQRTRYPFGLVERYRVITVKGEIVTLPTFREAFAEELRPLVRARIHEMESDREFHSHRSYQYQDPLTIVDWKKSAKAQGEKWVVKRFEAMSDHVGVVVQAQWSHAVALTDEAQFEDFLARLRTVFEVLREEGRSAMLELAPFIKVIGYDAATEVLAGLPRFVARREPIEPTWREERIEGSFIRVTVEPNNVTVGNLV